MNSPQRSWPSTVDLPLWPEHAGRHLIADLDDIRRRALLIEGRDDRFGIVVHGRGKRREVLPLPGSRYLLMRGIGPEVRVVQVEQELHIGLLDPACHRRHIGKRVEIGRGIDPQAQAHQVHVVVGQDLLGASRAGGVGERLARGFQGEQRGQIRAADQTCRARRAGEGTQRRNTGQRRRIREPQPDEAGRNRRSGRPIDLGTPAGALLPAAKCVPTLAVGGDVELIVARRTTLPGDGGPVEVIGLVEAHGQFSGSVRNGRTPGGRRVAVDCIGGGRSRRL